VVDLAFKQPRDGLQTGVRMSCNAHAGFTILFTRKWSVVIDKAPGANHSHIAMWQGAADFDAGSGRQLYKAWR
jgi:hypothetical protein